jgi:hypothetical protein
LLGPWLSLLLDLGVATFRGRRHDQPELSAAVEFFIAAPGKPIRD